MSTTPEDRIYKTYQAMRKSKAINQTPWSPEFDVAGMFKITCQQVRDIVAKH